MHCFIYLYWLFMFFVVVYIQWKTYMGRTCYAHVALVSNKLYLFFMMQCCPVVPKLANMQGKFMVFPSDDMLESSFCGILLPGHCLNIQLNSGEETFRRDRSV